MENHNLTSLYSIDITQEEFFQLYQDCFRQNNQLMQGLLFKTLDNNDSLKNSMWTTKIKASSNSASSTYFDELLRANRYDWVNSLLNVESSHAYIAQGLTKNLEKFKNNIVDVKYFFMVERAIKEQSMIKTEEYFVDSNFKPNLNKVLLKFAEVLCHIKGKDFLSEFFNAQIKRTTGINVKPFVVKPAFFTYLQLFNPRQLDQVQQHISWQARDDNQQNILYYLLEFPENMISYIVSKNHDWHIVNNNDKTPVRRLAETDFTNLYHTHRLNYILEHRLVEFSDNNDFRIMIKRVMRSYNLKTNSPNLNEEIKNLFITLLKHPLIESIEGKEALTYLDDEKIYDKIKDLRLALLHTKLDQNLSEKKEGKKLKL